jgi:hypothetical protein
VPGSSLPIQTGQLSAAKVSLAPATKAGCTERIWGVRPTCSALTAVILKAPPRSRGRTQPGIPSC